MAKGQQRGTKEKKKPKAEWNKKKKGSPPPSAQIQGKPELFGKRVKTLHCCCVVTKSVPSLPGLRCAAQWSVVRAEASPRHDCARASAWADGDTAVPVCRTSARFLWPHPNTSTT